MDAVKHILRMFDIIIHLFGLLFARFNFLLLDVGGRQPFFGLVLVLDYILVVIDLQAGFFSVLCFLLFFGGFVMLI